jgi:hypothetical protein
MTVSLVASAARPIQGYPKLTEGDPIDSRSIRPSGPLGPHERAELARKIGAMLVDSGAGRLRHVAVQIIGSSLSRQESMDRGHDQGAHVNAIGGMRDGVR